MPKVLRIVNRFNLGGPTYNAAYLTKYLAPEFETFLVGGMKDKSEESSEFILKNLNIDYRIIPSMRRSVNLFRDLSAYSELKNIIREFRPDIVHTHAAKAGALGRKAAFACNVPATVHTFHGHVFHSYFGAIRTSVYKAIERKLAIKTSAIIAISDKQKEELVAVHKIASTDKVHVIPLGFDLSRFGESLDEKRKNFRAKYDLTEDEIAIGIIGRLVPVKNHLLFIEAIKFVTERAQRKIRAFIIGDGELRTLLEQKVASYRLADRIVFTSWEKEVDKIYPGLDIVCMSSFNEGTPVSLIEAQAAGKPIVSTNVGGIENAVMPGQTALLSEVGDAQRFCENLLELVEDDAKRISFSRQGAGFVKDKFHYQRLVSVTRKLYLRLLAKTA